LLKKYFQKGIDKAGEVLYNYNRKQQKVIEIGLAVLNNTTNFNKDWVSDSFSFARLEANHSGRALFFKVE